jgi:hypothetical protein
VRKRKTRLAVTGESYESEFWSFAGCFSVENLELSVILWHIDPLLGISGETDRQQLLLGNGP